MDMLLNQERLTSGVSWFAGRSLSLGAGSSGSL